MMCAHELNYDYSADRRGIVGIVSAQPLTVPALLVSLPAVLPNGTIWKERKQDF